MVAGFFEHATALDTQIGPSNTDVFIVCGLSDGLGTLAVEGKAGESFGNLIGDWNNSDGKAARLAWACNLFGVTADVCADLRWQLFHRTLSAVIEAKRFRARYAIMLVHDFSLTGADDYARFAEAIGVGGEAVDEISQPQVIDGVSLRLAWVCDTPSP